VKAHADEDVAIRAAMLAIAASEPMGMGFLHYAPADDNPSEETVRAECLNARGISIDYYNGRMVKLYLDKAKDGTYNIPSHPANIEYQSWVRRYPTYDALFTEAIAQLKGESK
jgi:hypothetical protein